MTQPSPSPVAAGQRRQLIRRGFIAAFILVAALWAFAYCSPSARMLRATQKLATVVEKPEAEESTLALGLAVRHIEGVLHPEAELDVSGAYFIRLDGRREIVQLFANIRAHTQSLLLTNRRAGIVDKMKNEITAHIDVDFALHFADLNEAGRAGATVYWEKTDAGWKIRRLEIVAPRKFIQPL